MTEIHRTAGAARSRLQQASLIVGAVFLLVGVLGFIPGITTGYGAMEFAEHHSEAMLLGVFQVSVLHNLVHLLFGITGIVAAQAPSTARTFLIGGGVVYLALWVYGLAIDLDSDANFVPVNTADNWLHLALGLGMTALGILLTRRVRPGTTP
ncbi:DUF4383 domain-containing protein [Streptomyces sp. NPDC048560]|uniref:DUF4383 domain-containing protein n=1 Tax=Streptomyces sp. NPDC048560 TaxID=3155488 RepID=UPI00343C8A58